MKISVVMSDSGMYIFHFVMMVYTQLTYTYKIYFMTQSDRWMIIMHFWLNE